MPAEPLRPATSNHPFLTHAARTVQYAALWRAAGKRAVERSEERLVLDSFCFSNQTAFDLSLFACNSHHSTLLPGATRAVDTVD